MCIVRPAETIAIVSGVRRSDVVDAGCGRRLAPSLRIGEAQLTNLVKGCDEVACSIRGAFLLYRRGFALLRFNEMISTMHNTD